MEIILKTKLKNSHIGTKTSMLVEDVSFTNYDTLNNE